MAKPLIAISQLRYADSLASYLKSQQIPVQVHHVPADDQYVLVLDNDNDHARALEICEAFIQAPNDPKYQQAAWQHSERTDVPAEQAQGNSMRLGSNDIGVFVDDEQEIAHVDCRTQHPGRRELVTTLDSGAQRTARRLLSSARPELAEVGVHNGAAVVVRSGSDIELLTATDLVAGASRVEVALPDGARVPVDPIADSSEFPVTRLRFTKQPAGVVPLELAAPERCTPGVRALTLSLLERPGYEVLSVVELRRVLALLGGRRRGLALGRLERREGAA